MQKQPKRNDLIEPELSYKIVGVLYQVFNELGPGLHEKYYQKAVAEGFRLCKVHFQEQYGVPVQFANVSVGRYVLDFLVEEKIIVELKKGSHVNRKHAEQVFAYLKVLKMPLAILAYFGSDGVAFKRIINQEQYS